MCLGDEEVKTYHLYSTELNICRKNISVV